MKRSKTLRLLFSVLLLCCLTVGCQGSQESSSDKDAADSTAGSEAEPTTRETFAMDTYMTLTAYGDDAEASLDTAIDSINDLEDLLSTGIETSEISELNESGSGTVSETTGYLLKRSIDIYKETEGVFDITVYPIMEAWGFPSGDYRVPDDAELSELMQLMGADEIDYDESTGEVNLNKEGRKIDLGGIAKGYTSDVIIDQFREDGLTSAIISLGGNVKTLGSKPDGSAWRVAVENPDDPESGTYLGVISVRDKAVITSGGYERYFEEDGVTYHHIIDPSTGKPADSGLKSVTIVSEDGTLADGLSTSLFIMGADKAAEFWREHSDTFDTILVEDDGTILVSEGIADTFESNEEWEVIEK